jgi:competence protein ComEC
MTAILPFAAPLWATIAAAPISWMRHAVELLAKLPGSDVPLPSKSILLIAIYYALLCIPLLPTVRPRLKKSLRLSPAMAVLLFALLPLTGGSARTSDGSLRVTVLSIGAGQCCVLELPDGQVAMLDAGSATLSEPVQKCVAPFLRAIGRGSIDQVWLSHGDYDHVSAAAEIIRDYRVEHVVISDDFESHAADTPTDEALMETIRDRHVPLDHVHVGQHVAVAKDVDIEVLWPPPNSTLTSNNSGLVLKLTYARRTILFPADIQQLPEASLLRNPNQLRCDVLLAPHHGSFETTTPAFISAADPLYIVSSNDRSLTQKQRIFERHLGNRPLFRTHRCGAITIEIDKTGGLTVTPFLKSDQHQ